MADALRSLVALKCEVVRVVAGQSQAAMTSEELAAHPVSRHAGDHHVPMDASRTEPSIKAPRPPNHDGHVAPGP